MLINVIIYTAGLRVLGTCCETCLDHVCNIFRDTGPVNM